MSNSSLMHTPVSVEAVSGEVPANTAVLSGATGMHRSKQARTALRAGGKQLPLPANARPAGLSEHSSFEVLIRPARPCKNRWPH